MKYRNISEHRTYIYIYIYNEQFNSHMLFDQIIQIIIITMTLRISQQKIVIFSSEKSMLEISLTI
jgi:hypothetical protein